MAKKITIQTVAEAAGVSSASVSLFLNDKPGLAQATRERIKSAVNELDYVPRKKLEQQPQRARLSLAVEKLPFSMFSELHYGELLQSMQAEAQAFGYDLVLNVYEGATDEAADVLRRADGALILGGGDITEEVVNKLLQLAHPVLLVDVHFPSIDATSVLADNTGGAHKLVKHLLACGYRKIACIKGPAKYPSLTERFQGYCLALIEAGVTIEPTIVQPSISQGFPNKGYLEMKALLANDAPFDAVFCVSDRAALGALQALQEANVRIPEQLGLAGFEDVPQAQFTNPPLTTVKMPKTEMGKVAVRQIIKMIQEEALDTSAKIVLPTHLIKRSSTNPVTEPS